MSRGYLILPPDKVKYTYNDLKGFHDRANFFLDKIIKDKLFESQPPGPSDNFLTNLCKKSYDECRNELKRLSPWLQEMNVDHTVKLRWNYYKRVYERAKDLYEELNGRKIPAYSTNAGGGSSQLPGYGEGQPPPYSN